MKTTSIYLLLMAVLLCACGGNTDTANVTTDSTNQTRAEEDNLAESGDGGGTSSQIREVSVSPELKNALDKYPYIGNTAQFIERIKKANPDEGDYGSVTLDEAESNLLGVMGEVSTHAVAAHKTGSDYQIYVTIEQGHFDYMSFHVLTPTGELKSLGMICGGTGSAARSQEPECTNITNLVITDEGIDFTVKEVMSENVAEETKSIKFSAL